MQGLGGEEAFNTVIRPTCQLLNATSEFREKCFELAYVMDWDALIAGYVEENLKVRQHLSHELYVLSSSVLNGRIMNWFFYKYCADLNRHIRACINCAGQSGNCKKTQSGFYCSMDGITYGIKEFKVIN